VDLFIFVETAMKRFLLAGVTPLVALSFLGGAALADVTAPGPLGLPSVEVLREKLSLTDAQAKKVEAIYDDYKDKAKDVTEKGDAQKVAEVRHEIVGKIKDVCTGDQKKMLDEVVAETGRK
jgi:hypothetical protein